MPREAIVETKPAAEEGEAVTIAEGDYFLTDRLLRVNAEKIGEQSTDNQEKLKELLEKKFLVFAETDTTLPPSEPTKVISRVSITMEIAIPETEALLRKAIASHARMSKIVQEYNALVNSPESKTTLRAELDQSTNFEKDINTLWQLPKEKLRTQAIADLRAYLLLATFDPKLRSFWETYIKLKNIPARLIGAFLAAILEALGAKTFCKKIKYCNKLAKTINLAANVKEIGSDVTVIATSSETLEFLTTAVMEIAQEIGDLSFPYSVILMAIKFGLGDLCHCCKQCRGSGKIEEKNCQDCRGSGIFKAAKKPAVKKDKKIKQKKKSK